MEDNTVTLSEKRYKELLDTESFMRVLEAAGVDNWDGYDIAQDMFNGED